MHVFRSLAAASAVSLAMVCPAGAAPDLSRVDRELGRAGTAAGEVRRYSFPRSDLHVKLDGVRVEPALALGSWLAFRPVSDSEVQVVGDLVLTEAEVKPVLARLVAGGMSITALHNHLLRSEPGTMYMHVHGHGDPAALARTLRSALEASATPMTAPSPGRGGPFKAGRMDELKLHPTVKPVALVADAIRDVSNRGDLVLDVFGGSGTTLIAAEKTGRSARLIELDPLYCDVIVRRWEKLTGKNAVLERSGETFEREAFVRNDMKEAA